jgi:hypothetical protein
MRGWLGVVSKSHAQRGMAGGFIQLCHGRCEPLRRMAEGDRLVIYSPRTEMNGGEALQAFTAYGIVGPDEIVRVQMAPDFHPFRRQVRFLPAKDAPIRPLLDRLSFSRDVPNWGQILRRGQVPLTMRDLDLIAGAMGLEDL